MQMAIEVIQDKAVSEKMFHVICVDECAPISIRYSKYHISFLWRRHMFGKGWISRGWFLHVAIHPVCCNYHLCREGRRPTQIPDFIVTEEVGWM